MSVHVSSWVWKYAPAKGNALLVLLAIADIADADGHAFPGIQHLATMTRLSEITVSRRIGELEDAGTLTVQRRSGRASLYTVLMADPHQNAGGNPHQAESPQTDTPLTTDVDPHQNEHSLLYKNHQEPLEAEDMSDGQLDVSKSKVQQIGDDFSEFYDLYPRHVKKPRAEKAYRAAIKAGVSAATILEGARKYAASVAGKDSEFIAHPSTWLNDSRWTDEYKTGPVAAGYDRAKEFTPDDYS